MIEKRVILAGRCVFTITGKGGTHYTYKVKKLKDQDKWFVYLLTGSDNDSAFTYLGMLNPTQGKAFPTKKSKLKKDALPFRAINFALTWIWAGKPGEIESQGGAFQFAASCAVCGRSLTTPESLARGIGPECANRL